MTNKLSFYLSLVYILILPFFSELRENRIEIKKFFSSVAEFTCNACVFNHFLLHTVSAVF